MLQVDIGDRLTLRKSHVCGGKEWEVWRLGMDIGIKCLRCGRKIRIVRSELEKNVKKLVKASDNLSTGQKSDSIPRATR